MANKEPDASLYETEAMIASLKQFRQLTPNRELQRSLDRTVAIAIDAHRDLKRKCLRVTKRTINPELIAS